MLHTVAITADQNPTVVTAMGTSRRTMLGLAPERITFSGDESEATDGETMGPAVCNGRAQSRSMQLGGACCRLQAASCNGCARGEERRRFRAALSVEGSASPLMPKRLALPARGEPGARIERC